jgi:hypothetical protein
MHGLMNRSIQRFLQDTYGADHWHAVAASAGVGAEGFEAMRHYDDALTQALVAAAAHSLNKPHTAFLEDLGAYLVTIEPLRRLLRFGGGTYADFLMSLDELQGRGQMALPDIGLPALAISLNADGLILLTVKAPMRGWGAVLSGLVRAMADDYGALALIEMRDDKRGRELVTVELLEARFAAGRRFDLVQSAEV